MTKVLKLGLPLLAAIVLTACAKDIVMTASLCGDGTPQNPGAWQDIRIKNADVLTKGTADKILGNNVARDAVCTQQSPRG